MLFTNKHPLKILLVFN